MGKLSVFNFITLNGCYKGPDGDLSWHQHGGEEAEYAEKMSQTDSILLFGRITFEMMAGYWPGPQAKKDSPKVAEGMNKAEKIVFSTTLKKTAWSNSRIIGSDIIKETKNLKKTSPKDLTVLGSGSIVTQFVEHGLIDEYRIMLDPVVISGGTSIFNNINKNLNLKLKSSKSFKSGVILLCYEPTAKK